MRKVIGSFIIIILILICAALIGYGALVETTRMRTKNVLCVVEENQLKVEIACVDSDFLTMFSYPLIPQDHPRLSRDINKIFNVNDFKRIVQYILDNGDRQTYNNMYNNNPHYSLKDFDIYLDPISQWINFRKEYLSAEVNHYNRITIMDWNSKHVIYYRIMLYNEKVWIYNLYEVEQTNYEKEIINKYIPKLKLLIDKEK